MRLTLPFPPSLNHLYATVRGRRVLSKAGRDYKSDVAKLVRAAPMEGPLEVSVRVYRPRRAGDLDNTLKCLLDSLKGIAWVDDSQVERIHAERFDDKANPRVELEVAPVATDAVAKELQAARPQILAAVRKEIADWTSLARPAVYRRKP